MGQRLEVRALSMRYSPANTTCSLVILKDWVDLIDEEGWVAREQILGEEARSKVITDDASPRHCLT